MDLAELEQLGLYDPDTDAGGEHRALFEYLGERGVTVEAIRALLPDHALGGMAGEVALTDPPTYTGLQLAEHAGVSFETLVAMLRSLGLQRPDPFRLEYSDGDVAMVRALRPPPDLFPTEAAFMGILRVIGSSVAAIAEAGVAAYIRHVEHALNAQGAPPVAHARAQIDAVLAYGRFAQALQPLLRRHTRLAVRRQRDSRMRGEHGIATGSYAVGFVDLVGFTPLAQEIDTEELAELVTRFEALAFDIVSDHDGRVVKLIGDEVMFVAVEPREACEIALSLVEGFDRTSHNISPRAGVAYGDVLTREGDFFGPTVNLASRIVEQAVAGDVLVTESVIEAAADEQYAFEGAGRRMLKGFAEPVRLWCLQRAGATSIA